VEAGLKFIFWYRYTISWGQVSHYNTIKPNALIHEAGIIQHLGVRYNSNILQLLSTKTKQTKHRNPKQGDCVVPDIGSEGKAKLFDAKLTGSTWIVEHAQGAHQGSWPKRKRNRAPSYVPVEWNLENLIEAFHRSLVIGYRGPSHAQAARRLRHARRYQQLARHEKMRQ